MAKAKLFVADSRMLEPTAYIHDRNTPPRMYEVIEANALDGMIVLEDCKTLHRSPFDPAEVLQRFELVKAACRPPDHA